MNFKRSLLTLGLGLFFPFFSFSQDSLFLHTGEVKNVKVIKVGEDAIDFQFPNEDAMQTISHYAVAKIKYGKSGRLEEISDKILIAGEDDWQKVVILETKDATAGLEKGPEITGKTSLINYRSAKGGEEKATEKIKKAAAKNLSPFILITKDKTFNLGAAWGSSQSSKKGICYKY